MCSIEGIAQFIDDSEMKHIGIFSFNYFDIWGNYIDGIGLIQIGWEALQVVYDNTAISSNDLVWTKINRMNRLNVNQPNSKRDTHIGPLRFGLIARPLFPIYECGGT